jgi:hypothetical protein
LNRLVEFQSNGLGIDDMIYLAVKRGKLLVWKDLKANSAAKRTTSAHVFISSFYQWRSLFATKSELLKAIDDLSNCVKSHDRHFTKGIYCSYWKEWSLQKSKKTYIKYRHLPIGCGEE